MNSQKSLIISIIVALLILGGAVVFVKFKTAAPSAAAPSGAQAEQVAIDDAMAACTDKDQCIIVDTKCSFCCDYQAINANSEAIYNKLFDKTCKNYSGTYCQCHDLTSYPSCIQGKCQMVKWSENKPIKTPPAPAGTQPPARQPPATQPPATQPPAQAPAIAEEVPAAEIPAEGVPEDLYAPLPDAPPAPADDDAVHVIQP